MMGRGELRIDGRSETLQAMLAADDVAGWVVRTSLPA